MSFLALVFRHPVLAAKTMGDILSEFIKLLVGACFNLATLLSSGSTAFLLGVGSAPNAALLVSLLYLFYLAILELLNLAVSLVVLPVRLCSRWIDSVG